MESEFDRIMVQPLVSIVIPVYNGANYMREAIDSALAQTYPNIEIIVVNDGSGDDGETERIALSYGDQIRYFRKENGGVSSALNLGISKMQGEYFSWLSHDDKYTPEKVQMQIDSLRQCGFAEDLIAMCSFRQIDKNSNFFRDSRPEADRPDAVYSWEESLCKLFAGGSLNGCALLIPKTAFAKCGLFDEDLRYGQDFLMWAKLFLGHYRIVSESGCGVYGRVHDKQLTQTGKSLFQKDSKRICDILLEPLAACSTKENGVLFAYSRYNAVYDVSVALKACLTAGREQKKLTAGQRMKLRCLGLYGKIRPWIRKLYYKLFKRINTQ